jgi:hypothetical protein
MLGIRASLLLARWCAMAVLATSLAGCGKDRRDALIMRNGTTLQGTLASCDAKGCTLDGKPYPRQGIDWIGLAVGDAAPPKVAHPETDEEHLRDGSVRSAQLLSIDAGTVVVASASLPRAQVAFIHLARPSAASALPRVGGGPGALKDKVPPPSYEWHGHVTLESTMDQPRWGRHRWVAEYELRLQETPNTSSCYQPGTTCFALNDIGPLALSYTYSADQDWDRGSDAPPRDVHMHGLASGRITEFDRWGNSPSGGLGVRGDVLRMDEPKPPVSVPTSFANWGEINAFFELPPIIRPGRYQIIVSAQGSPAAQRQLYRGIEKTGGARNSFGGPYGADSEFLNYVPAGVPPGTLSIYGFLDNPDQAEVRGAYSVSVTAPDPAKGDPPMLSYRWEFTRSRRAADPSNANANASPPADDCAGSLATLASTRDQNCSALAAATARCKRDVTSCSEQLGGLQRACDNATMDYQQRSAACASRK